MSRLGSRASAAPRSDATMTASRRGERAGTDPAIRSVIQRKNSPCAASISARNATSPSAIRQYRLRYHTSSDIGRLVPAAPDGQDDRRIRGVLFDLLSQALHERVDAAHGDERRFLPRPAEKRV